MQIMESKLHEVSPHYTHCIMLEICKLVPFNCNSYCVIFWASNVMQMRNLFFFDVVLPEWMFVVKCFKTMHWPNLWGSLVQTLDNKHPVAEHSIAEDSVSKFLTNCWPFIGNIWRQYLTVIHNTFPLWLYLHNSSLPTLFPAHLCFPNNF